MTQNALSATVSMQKSGSAYVQKQLSLGSSGELISTTGGVSSLLNVSAATVVKTGQGRVVRVSVITAGSTSGTVNDTAATGSAAIGNQIATIPNTVGTYALDWPVGTGIVVVPGTGQVLAVAYL
jgi:hypothetical protein